MRTTGGFVAALATDVGRVRDHNEDAGLVTPNLVAVADGHAEEVGQLRVGGRPALEAAVRTHVGQALGRGVVEHGGEDAVLARQGADGAPLFLADAVHH